MTVKIEKKIVHASVVEKSNPAPKPLGTNGLVARPDVLDGKTYKIKTPSSDHALYVTVTDMNGKPFEMFVSCKDMSHFQWIVALTRVVSAVFRHAATHEGDASFVAKELAEVFDPKGGHFSGGRFVPSLVAEIGMVLNRHFQSLGLLKEDDSLAEAARAMVAEKLEAKAATSDDKGQCGKCGAFAVVILDGCATCLDCGDSKCG